MDNIQFRNLFQLVSTCLDLSIHVFIIMQFDIFLYTIIFVLGIASYVGHADFILSNGIFL